MSEPRPAIQRLRRRKERHKQRSKLYRVPFALVGGLVVLVGVGLSLPGVPGPGLLLIALGLAMLALEFDRAERLLERIIDRVEEAREKTSTLQEVLLLVGGLAAIAGYVVAAFLWEIPILPG
jgi:Putative transmembrane protein (PGPGW)